MDEPVDSGAISTRDLLIERAADLLERQGRDALTLRALGAEAGLSRGAPYRHFADKDELLAALAARAMQALNEEMTRAWARGRRASPATRLERMLWAYTQKALACSEHYRLIFSPDVDPALHPDVALAGAEAFRTLLGAVSEARGSATTAPGLKPVTVAALLFSSVHGLIDLQLSGHGEPGKGLSEPRGLIRQLVLLVLLLMR